MTPESLPDPLAVAISFSEILERLDIRHLVGGSLASSVHGEPRSTNDIDILADFGEEHSGPFVEAVQPEYYVSATAVRGAVRSALHFNVIHMSAALKVDVFLAGKDPFDQERLRLRERLQVSTDPPAHLWMDTAEHSVLRKLEWYRRGGEVSERQWRDVVAILRIQGSGIDGSRLDDWGRRLGVTDLVARAWVEAQRGG
jgi:hypothetical protein